MNLRTLCVTFEFGYELTVVCDATQFGYELTHMDMSTGADEDEEKDEEKGLG